eukprot:TRINITY_DN4804_c0_g1_i3.p1 TRINITY_DN4804_c0_g1~~TRINITY_DN4804_c0_g1_i3.p1  ORF type:complete len:405 (+),score=74.09 TRINITY_DN4804_c0_g1_i3:96-1217(+)
MLSDSVVEAVCWHAADPGEAFRKMGLHLPDGAAAVAPPPPPRPVFAAPRCATWSCSACTFRNTGDVSKCAMCDTPRPSGAAAGHGPGTAPAPRDGGAVPRAGRAVGRGELPSMLVTAAVVVAAVRAVKKDIHLWERAVPAEVWRDLGLVLRREDRGRPSWWCQWLRRDGRVWRYAADADGKDLLHWKEHKVCREQSVELLKCLLAFKRGNLEPVPYREDRAIDKMVRACTFIRKAAPLVPIAKWKDAMQVVGRMAPLLKHGPMALGMLVLNDRVKEALLEAVECLREGGLLDKLKQEHDISHVGLLISFCYLMAYRRGERGDNPRLNEQEHSPAAEGVRGDISADDLHTAWDPRWTPPIAFPKHAPAGSTPPS